MDRLSTLLFAGICIVIALGGLMLIISGNRQRRRERGDAPQRRHRARAATGWLLLIPATGTALLFLIGSPDSPFYMLPRAQLPLVIVALGLLPVALVLWLLARHRHRRAEDAEAEDREILGDI